MFILHGRPTLMRNFEIQFTPNTIVNDCVTHKVIYYSNTYFIVTNYIIMNIITTYF